MDVLSYPDFVNATFEAAPSILGDEVIGCRSFTLLTGQEGIGKSLLVLQLAYHVAAGIDFLGFTVPRAHKVLLIQKELPERSLQERGIAQLNGRLAPPSLHIVPTAGGVHLSGGILHPHTLEEWLRVERPDLLILDPLVEFHNANENAAHEMAATILRPLERWKAQGTSVLLVHHHGKPNEEHPRSGSSLARGSSTIAGSADAHFQLFEINAEKYWYQLVFPKMRRTMKPAPIALVRDPDTLLYSIRGAYASILDTLRQSGGEMTTADLVAWAVANLKITKQAAYRAVKRLVEAGRVQEVEGKTQGTAGRPRGLIIAL